MTTAAERLVTLAGAGTAGALLLLIGTGSTAGAALVDYSRLPSATAAVHLMTDIVEDNLQGGAGWIDYGEQKRKREEKDALIAESKTLIANIKAESNPQELFTESALLTSKIKQEIERLGIKAAYFERLHNEQLAAQALYDQEQLQAQIEEIDVVYMTFLMIAHLD
jgi:hypothetical protein